MDNKIEEAKEHLKSIMTKDELQFIIDVTHKMATIRAVWKTGSIDPSVCAEFLYKDKGQILPVSEFKMIVMKWLLELAKRGLLDEDGKLTDDAILMAKHHESILNGNEDMELRDQINNLKNKLKKLAPDNYRSTMTWNEMIDDLRKNNKEDSLAFLRKNVKSIFSSTRPDISLNDGSNFIITIMTGRDLKDKFAEITNKLSDDNIVMYGPVLDNKILNVSMLTVQALRMIILSWDEYMDEALVAVGFICDDVTTNDRYEIDKEKTLQNILNRCNSTNGISIDVKHFNKRLKDKDFGQLLIRAAQFVGAEIVYKS